MLLYLSRIGSRQKYKQPEIKIEHVKEKPKPEKRLPRTLHNLSKEKENIYKKLVDLETKSHDDLN